MAGQGALQQPLQTRQLRHSPYERRLLDGRRPGSRRPRGLPRVRSAGRGPAFDAGHPAGAATQDLLIERPRLRLGLGPQLLLEDRYAALVLSQGGTTPLGVGIELHQCAVNGLLERIEREEPERGLNGVLRGASRPLVSEHSPEDTEGKLAQSLTRG